jgi:glucokinase
MTLHLGIDLGATNVKWALIERNGAVRVAATGTNETLAHQGPARVVKRLVAISRDVLGSMDPDSVGVGLPGLFDEAAGTTTFLPNLPGDWLGIPVAKPLKEAVSAPVTLVNDARAFAVGESRLGGGRGCLTAVFVTLGTGVGGGVVIGGRLHLGLGTAGELGHQTVAPDGPRCTCGNRGCVEALACAGAISAAAGCETVEEVVAAARAGDRSAHEALESAGRYLGVALANVIVLLAPERIVVGGGVAAAGDALLGPVRAEVRARVHVAPVERVEIVPGELGTCAGAIGAALWAAERV